MVKEKDKGKEVLEKELEILEKELEVLMWGFTEAEYSRFWKRKEKVKQEAKEDESI